MVVVKAVFAVFAVVAVAVMAVVVAVVVVAVVVAVDLAEIPPAVSLQPEASSLLEVKDQSQYRSPTY